MYVNEVLGLLVCTHHGIHHPEVDENNPTQRHHNTYTRGEKTNKNGWALIRNMPHLSIGDGGKALLFEFLHCFFIVSKIELGSNKNDGCVWAMVTHLRRPLQWTRHREMNTQWLTIVRYTYIVRGQS